MSITLTTVSSGYNLAAINANFQSLQTALNNNILWRNGSVAGESLMDRDLDMNGNNILNLATDLSQSGSLITVGQADARYVNVTGDVLEGAIDADGNSITGLPVSVNASDAVRKSELDAEALVRSSTDAYLQDQIIGEQDIPASERPVVQWHSNTLSTSFTVPDNMNAFSIGPQLIIEPGQTVTLGTNSVWNILGNAFSASALYDVKANNLTTSNGASTVSVATLAGLPARMTAEETKVQSVALGGTGATTAAAARTNLGAAASAGVTDASNAAAGAVGEVISSTVSSVSITTSNVSQNITSIVLTPGDWDITGAIEMVGSVGATSIFAGSSNTSATSQGFPYMLQLSNLTAATSAQRLPIPTVRRNISATTTIYLIATAVFASGTMTAQGYISARRMR